MDSHSGADAKAGRDINTTPPPPRTNSGQPTSKPKKEPTITPKRFKKFFTPSSLLERCQGVGVSRLALGQITTSTTKWKGGRAPQKASVAFTAHRMENATVQADDVPMMEGANVAALTIDETEDLTLEAADLPTMATTNIAALTADEAENATLGDEDPSMANYDQLEETPEEPDSLKRKRDSDGDSDSEYGYDSEDEEEDEPDNDEYNINHNEDDDSDAGLSQAELEEKNIEEAWKDMKALQSEVEREYKEAGRAATRRVNPFVGSWYSGPRGAISRRELQMPANRLQRPLLDYANNWQAQTADFYSRPNDIHTCKVVGTQSIAKTLPFCTDSFNTIALVAIGDEDGGVRFLDSDKVDKVKAPGFAGTFLDFKPHNNAVLEVTLSADDRLLATGSGDQTARIIDVMTRHTIHTLLGHTASVKHVKFQPGSSNNVVSTCSRDGCVKIWDLRCNTGKGPRGEYQMSSAAPADSASSLYPPSSVSDEPSSPGLTEPEHPPNVIPDCTQTLRNAHTIRSPPYTHIARKARTQPGAVAPTLITGTSSRKGAVSVTAMSWLDAARPHLLMTGSEANACVSLWDIRGKMNNRRTHAIPVSATLEPGKHAASRSWGIASMVLSPDTNRLYTLTKDSTIYVYNTQHLILGAAPEFKPAQPDDKYQSPGEAQCGLGPRYGFRHPNLDISSFYAKLAIRPAGPNHRELLAVGSHEKCAVIFPTDERYQRNRIGITAGRSPELRAVLKYIEKHFERPPPSFFDKWAKDTCDIYDHGTALFRGHDGEVTDVCWTTDGELVTVSDDDTARIWREDEKLARKMRTMDMRDAAERYGWAWSEVIEEWDDDDTT